MACASPSLSPFEMNADLDAGRFADRVQSTQRGHLRYTVMTIGVVPLR